MESTNKETVRRGRRKGRRNGKTTKMLDMKKKNSEKKVVLDLKSCIQRT